MWLNFTLFQQIVQDAEETARHLSADPEAQQAWARSRPERERQVFFLIRGNTPSIDPLAPDDRLDLRAPDPDLPTLYQLGIELQEMLQDVCFPIWER